MAATGQTYDGEILLDATVIEELLTGLAGLLQLINPKNRMGSARLTDAHRLVESTKPDETRRQKLESRMQEVKARWDRRERQDSDLKSPVHVPA